MKWTKWMKNQSMNEETNLENIETGNQSSQDAVVTVSANTQTDNPVVVSNSSISIALPTTNNSALTESSKPPDYESILPPDYQTATDLPSYEEAERTKGDAVDNSNTTAADPITGLRSNQPPDVTLFNIVFGEQPTRVSRQLPSHSATASNLESGTNNNSRRIGNTRNIWSRWGSTRQQGTNAPRFNILPLGFTTTTTDWNNLSHDVIGKDTSFLTCFFISFIFNWIGFLFAICVSQTIAGRCGALSGFGLSIIKWTFIVKHSLNYTPAEIWLWWLLIILGALLFFKGCVQYLQYRPYSSTNTASRNLGTTTTS